MPLRKVSFPVFCSFYTSVSVDIAWHDWQQGCTMLVVPWAHQLLDALQGSCSDLILADLTPLASTALVPPDMLSYTVYLGAFQNSSTHAGPNALSFQGCPGVVSTWSKASRGCLTLQHSDYTCQS